MERKGVNKRKPKTKSKPVSKAETNGPSQFANTVAGEKQ
jgi:hypothetical protein